MDNLLLISTADKITLLNEIRRNYSVLKKQWTVDKVEWLQSVINEELKHIGDFELCKHENEVQKQGNGFVYTVCGDCGQSLD